MEKIWIKNYPPGVAAVIDPDQYTSLSEALESFCYTYADQDAFVNFGTALTYRQLAEYSERLAGYFQQELALIPGERVALMMPNILQFPVVLFAVLRAGLVVVNVNPLYTPLELKRELLDSGAAALVVLADFAHKVEVVRHEVPLRHIVVTQIGDLLGFLKGGIINIVSQFILKNVPPWHIPDHHDFKKALRIGETIIFNPPDISSSDIAFLQYTGGTTGIPKGAMLSHRNVLANVLQCCAWIQGKLVLGQETLLAALPLYHIFSLTVSGFTFLALGGKCVLVTDPRHILSVVRCWRKHSPTCFIGLNTLFLHLMANSEFTQLNFQRLKLTIAGGMPTQSAVAEQWQAITGCMVTEGYGLTEASPVVTINPFNLPYVKHRIGLPIPSTDIKICDDQGSELTIGEIGELYVKGPQVMQSYWENPQETIKVFASQGWLKTGDMARMDAAGFIYLVDRKKDLIIVSGFNVYPSEVEAVIAAHPEVADVAVVGEVDGATGEIVKAVVVKRDSSLTAESLIHYCRERLTPYKIPKKIEFRDKIPRSPLGKTLRGEL